MVSKTVIGLFTVGAVALAVSAAAMADAKSAIEARQACMKAHAGMIKVMVPMLKGQAPYDKKAIDGSIDASDAACSGWAGWWGEDTKPGGAVKTLAKAEIWSDPKGFEAAGMTFYNAEQAVKAAPDEAGFKATFPVMGKACQACHEKFRQPLE